MQSQTSSFFDVEAFATAVAEHLRERLDTTVMAKRVFNLDEAASYCGLTKDGFKKKVIRDRIRKVRLDRCWRFDKVDLDCWIDSHKEEIDREAA